jgi:hypothetical protein
MHLQAFPIHFKTIVFEIVVHFSFCQTMEQSWWPRRRNKVIHRKEREVVERVIERGFWKGDLTF